MKKKTLPLSEVYRLIEPGPVVLVSSHDGIRPNVMTMTWHTMLDFEPPVLACVIGESNYTFETVRETRECVINIPTIEIAKQTVGCGNCSGRKTDKFKKFKLTPLPAARTKAPLIKECYANLECKVIDSRLIGQYNLFVMEVVKAWVTLSKKRPRTIHHQGKGFFAVDGRVIKLPSKMK